MSEEQHKETAAHTKGSLNQIETTLDLYLVKKAPKLPPNVKEVIVKFAPWLVIIMAILVLPAILGLFGLSAILTSTPYGAVAAATLGPTYYLSIILLIGVVGLELFALPGLFARKRSGWQLVFYATLISAVSNLLSANIASFIISTLISLYFLFQVREYYK